ncbi:MAG: hypothetical protein IPM39_01650 [Chloroflexi bacterium]|nr:hypothetical protein [Chloroflexota bacterium]
MSENPPHPRLSAPNESHTGQLLNYLKATQIEVGLLLNFGPDPQFKRKAFSNEHKTYVAKNPR